MAPSWQTIIFTGFVSLVEKRLAPHSVEERCARPHLDLGSNFETPIAHHPTVEY